ncbi:cytochrome P450 [Schizophyllum amplum]|uniref:Cytochrome P450 n=1 Tax=Schizophyllum amplum TaxID=97359 RepID=A0A550C4C1_9AGAR|nr:cytochrome P450 [Auriculariopsis ampla]
MTSVCSRLSIVLLALLCSVALHRFYARRRRSLHLPPGPRKLPIVGNLFDIPTTFEWERYMEWARELETNIIHLDAAGQSIIVLDTYEACVDLLEKRSKVYSSRPHLTMAMDLVGLDFSFGLSPYGEHWRARRRLTHGLLHASASARFRPIELRAAHTFLRAMLSAGAGDLESEVRYMAGIVILRVAYGLDITSKDDPNVTAARAAAHTLIAVATPGAFFVNSLPALKYVPEWMPGAGFQRQAREWHGLARKVVDRPFNRVKDSTANGMPVNPSFTSIALEKGVDDAVIRDAAATMYLAGADTTAVTLLNFTLAMLDRPELQTRAQVELDAILAPGQLPDFTQENQLPFVTAIVLETLRWMPVAPVAVVHSYNGMEADIYEGYTIPAGSIVVPNVWSMVHDETVYPDSYTFRPERFLTSEGELDTDVRDPRKFVFGFGRRICPGRNLAYDSVWITIASVLRVFNIEKATRADGSIIEPAREWVSGLVLSPKHFQCIYVPRSEEAANLIRNTENYEYL